MPRERVGLHLRHVEQSRRQDVSELRTPCPERRANGMTNVTTPRGHISLDDEVDQPIPPEVWTRLVFQGQDAFVLVQGLADIDIQLYPADIVDPLKRPKVWQTMVRRLDGTKDGNVTGREPITWPQIRNACIRYLNLNLGVEPGVPLTFDVWHNAPSTVILTKRVPKLFVKRVDG